MAIGSWQQNFRSRFCANGNGRQADIASGAGDELSRQELPMKSVIRFCAFIPVPGIPGLAWMIALGGLYVEEEWLSKMQPA
jgi:hypothetical protein